MTAKSMCEIKGVLLTAVRRKEMNKAMPFRDLVTWKAGRRRMGSSVSGGM